jgi:IPT/TIG domain
MKLVAYVVGIIVLLVLWLLYRLIGKTWNLWKLVEGADGLPITSKLQWLIWTAVVIFAYTVVYTARAWTGDFSVITDIPQNLLIAMGFSVTAMAAAKGITVSYVKSGQVTKDKVASKTGSSGGIIKDDDGFPDLSKLQMMAWTLIASGIYLICLIHEINAGALGHPLRPPTLPDIDAALMVLMGLGQGAYLGKKLVTTTVPRLTGLSPGSGTAGTIVTVVGMAFGDSESQKQGGSLLTIDGHPFIPEQLNWNDTQIKFKVPDTQLGGSNWSAGQLIRIGVIVGGQESANTLPFTVTP